MRQVATAPDGVGYVIDSVLATFGSDETPARRMAQLTEDGAVIGANQKGHPFETFSAARSAAWERFVARSRGVGITEYRSANGGCGTLMWRTE